MEIMLSEMDGREAVHQVRAIEKGQGVQSTYGVKIIKTTTVQDIKEATGSGPSKSRNHCSRSARNPVRLGHLRERSARHAALR
jgi:CheY-like chemotaxis protein